VLATDNKYVVPTAVAVQSIKSSDPCSIYQITIFTDGVSRENMDKLQTMSDERCTIVLVDLQDSKWKSMPTIDGQQIDLMDFADQIKCEGWSQLVNLRLLFPDIWYSGLLPEDVQNINSFLWLDSDLIVMKSLNPLFDECGRIDQEVISANLYFAMHGGVGWVDAKYFSPPFPDQQDKDGFARVSGGVVFWKIEKLVDRFVAQGFNEFLTLYKERKCKERRNPPDEVILGDFLKQRACVYFFSPRYNANPDPKLRLNFFMHWPESPTEEDYRQRTRIGLIRNKVCMNPFVALKDQEDIKCFDEHMQALCNGDVHIFHWDCVQKPWKKSCVCIYSDMPTRCWYTYRQQTPFKIPLSIPQEIEMDLTE
jgi:lipopolysaccharide biosynthesis glycosyltransferase